VVDIPTSSRDALTAFFWEGAREHKLLIQRCQQCGYYTHPPRDVCRNCLSTELAPSQVSGKGRLYSYTVAHQAFHPAFVDRVPYIVATITLDEQPGLQVLSNVVGCDEDELTMDMPVEVTFEKMDADVVLPMFRKAR
jgi:uncharacterized OB-fold protein